MARSRNKKRPKTRANQNRVIEVDASALEQVAAELALPSLADDDITASRLAEKSGRSLQLARRFLNMKVTLGEYSTHKALTPEGKVITVYVPIALPAVGQRGCKPCDLSGHD